MIADHLTDSITIVRTPERDEFGEPILPEEAVTPEVVLGLVVYGMRSVRNSTGEQAVSSATVMLLDQVTPGIDRLVFAGSEHAVLAITQKNDWDNVFFKVWCA
jgi:hypothetical protein